MFLLFKTREYNVCTVNLVILPPLVFENFGIIWQYIEFAQTIVNNDLLFLTEKKRVLNTCLHYCSL